MPTLLVRTEFRIDRWVKGLTDALPGLEVRVWPDRGDPLDIDYTLVWQPPQELFQGLDNLKAIFSIGAGVDHLLGDLELPQGVPVVRMVDDTLTEGMTDFVLYNVLKLHRQFDLYDDKANEAVWKQHPQVRNQDRRIGFMGMGVLGQDAAAALIPRGFDVACWTRTAKTLPDVKSYAGEDTLDEFLARTDILIVLLPLTPETADIINAGLLAKLPAGACFINAGRGGHVDEDALVAALDSGQLRHAVLDVFKTEPLPADSPLWRHPGITITPHAASLTLPETAAERIAANIKLMEAGETPDNIADLGKGY